MENYIDILLKNEGLKPRKGFGKFARWAVAYLQAGSIDPQTIDISAYYDSMLTQRENKEAFKVRIPIGAELALAQIRLDEAKSQQQAADEGEKYVSELHKADDERLKQILAGQAEPLAPHMKTMRALVKNVMDGFSPALFILSDEPGIGKTHQVLSAIQENGWTLENDVGYFSGYATPLSLYQFFFDNRDKKLIVLDDLDQVYRNPVVLAMLKNATFGIPSRKVSYMTTSKLRTAPEEFEMTAPIIFIANKLPNNMQVQALLSRSLYLEIHLTGSQKKEMMASFAKLPYKNTTQEQRVAALELLFSKNPDAMSEFSFRLIQKAYNIILQYPEAEKWQPLVSEIISYDDEMLAFLQASAKVDVSEAVRVFFELTGKSRASFFRLKRRFEWLNEGKSLKSQFIGA
jgi:hypothetical protein